MKETVYNLFLFVEDGMVTNIAVASHVLGGSDTDKLRRLQECAREDVGTVRRLPLPSRFQVKGRVDGQERIVAGLLTYERYRRMTQANEHLELFEDAFASVGAPPDPLVCISPVVGGALVVDGVENFGVGPLT